MGPVSDDERNGLLNHSPLYGKYEEEVDRESAFEMLQQGAGRHRAAVGSAGEGPAERR
ncbi:DUF853 family protein [Klebsiella pneumoniae]|nr:DUF853 family protein [Klebsiella pneumoniae]